ncbi:MAG: thiamine diphosphokinase [Aerococcus sp.]|nr:thiamine diphosphokinase [Aerococcus sp.]
MRYAYFIGSGPFDAEQFLKDVEEDRADAKRQQQSFETYFIGCDRGALRFLTLPSEREPKMDLAIGDYDSITPKQRASVQKAAASFIGLPAEKDETDIEAAINAVLKDFAPMDAYIFYGALGGRLDHTLHNIWLGRQPRYQDIIDKFQLRSNDNDVTFLKPGTHVLHQMSNRKYLSFIALETVLGLDLIEAKYPLTHYDMPFAQSMISNEFLTDTMTIHFESGIMLAMQTRDHPTQEKEA